MGFGIVGFVASLDLIARFLSPDPLCGTTMGLVQRSVLLLLMIVVLVGALVAAVLLHPFSPRLVRAVSDAGLGLYAAIEFLMLVTVLASASQTSVNAWLFGVLGAGVVGVATGLRPELTIGAMGVAGAVYSLVGGNLFNYAAEPQVRACLGEQSNFAVVAGFAVAVGVSWFVLSLLRGRP